MSAALLLTRQTFNVLWATMGQYVKQGLVSDSRILDIKHVDISTGKLLENNVPVFLVTFASQEQLVFRSAKTGEVVVGSERDVESCRYAMVLTRLEAELENELTGGWKVVEVSRYLESSGPGAVDADFADGSSGREGVHVGSKCHDDHHMHTPFRTHRSTGHIPIMPPSLSPNLDR
jgi:hypothetical protein